MPQENKKLRQCYRCCGLPLLLLLLKVAATVSDAAAPALLPLLLPRC